MRLPSHRIVLLTALLGAVLPPCAHAGLGDSVEQIEHDRIALRAARGAVNHATAYDRHELRTPEGGIVHEFADRTGRVFAVTFEGPIRPDLGVLLGRHYAEYAAKAHASPNTHKVYTHTSATLHLSVIKGPRQFYSTAVVPGTVPAGVDPRDLH